MKRPGTEFQPSEWFADVQQSVIERRLTMSARDYVGHLSTVSAYLELPTSEREQVAKRSTNGVRNHTGAAVSSNRAPKPSRGAVPAFEAHPTEHPCSGAMEQCVRF